MKEKRIEPFKITTMDSLGQGVSKENGQVTFIAKTLPEEEGETKIYADRKGVSFGSVSSIKKTSGLRIDPVCQHFSSCPSCHYLHTSYEDEIGFKLKSFEKLFYKLPLPKIKVIKSDIRVGYRNRVQLHYDTKNEKLGMFNSLTKTIVEVPQCLIGISPVLEKVRELYTNKNWLKKAPIHTPTGHVEIYHRNGETHVSWNQEYAKGGFTQVHAEMNQSMKSEINLWYQDKKETVLLDLFAGTGNLSNELNYSSRLCVDIYNQTSSTEFLSIDLYENNALPKVKRALERKNQKPEVLLLDPPRSGMKDLNLWLSEFNPKHVAYVSCDPHTLVRDLLTLTNYEITEALLMDFFPSTFHFESLIFLQRKG